VSELSLMGRDLFGDVVKPIHRSPVLDRFILPPFSIWDGRSGAWQERKRAWLSAGVDDGSGREAPSIHCPTSSWNSASMALPGEPPPGMDRATSVFDPVIAELSLSWFSPRGGTVLDPFAGGSCRGMVAAHLGRNYWGCDLRNEQVEANRAILARSPGLPGSCEWAVADALEAVPNAPRADMIMSCPPYGDLEVYSDDPRDLSNMEWETFRAAYRRIILRSVARLKEDRFAVFTVGDFRDARGRLRGFTQDTISAFTECGAHFYNHAIYVTPCGSAPMRANQFDAGRKLVKTHQDVLVFIKGDPMKAARACVGGA
jgi:hypothetical protein